MDSNHKQDTYTMPLKQLLKLLETTADDAPSKRRRPRRRPDGKPVPALPREEPDVFRF